MRCKKRDGENLHFEFSWSIVIITRTAPQCQTSINSSMREDVFRTQLSRTTHAERVKSSHEFTIAELIIININAFDSRA